jgi:predicted transposase/invertase (TIGR01784 family)
MDNNEPNNPHDTTFKAFFSNKEIVISFIEENLPPLLVKELDLGSLIIQKDSFIDKELTEHFSDILYMAKYRDSHSFIYFLLEHKSYNDNRTGFQLLRNMVKIWELHLKQNPNAMELPVITPVVIHHSEKQWSCKNNFMELFDQSEVTSKYIPQFQYELYDLTVTPDENIKGILPLKIQMFLHKYIRSPKLLERFPLIADYIKDLDKQENSDYLEVIVRYLSSTVDQRQFPQIREILVDKLKESDKVMATMADKWFQDGVEKGIGIGVEKGIGIGVEKGIGIGIEKVAKTMLSKGKSSNEIHELTGLSLEQIESIRRNGMTSSGEDNVDG